MSVIINSAPCPSSFTEFAEVSEGYISEFIEKSKPKSCCLDPLPTRVLKQSTDVLANPITEIINTSLKTGVFPTSLKKGNVQPLIKKRTLDCEEFSNYRPITNIVFLSKTINAPRQHKLWTISPKIISWLNSNQPTGNFTARRLLCCVSVTTFYRPLTRVKK